MLVWVAIPGKRGQATLSTGGQRSLSPFSGMGSLEFSKLLLEKALVAVSPGVGFGPLGEGYVRFALVENEQRIRQAVRGIGAVLRAGA